MRDKEKNCGYLTDYSPRDKPWDAHRSECEEVCGIYALVDEFERYAKRMSQCSGCLCFGWVTDTETGEAALKLRECEFCRVRHCPVCQWRRALMWQARFYQALPKILGAYPSARWVFLTLTVRNCSIGELGLTLTEMNAAFQRLKDRKEFKRVIGWVRTTEVTRGSSDQTTAHPHFHTLMMVPASWFTCDYVKHARWVELWAECLRGNYLPNVDIRVVKSKKLKDNNPASKTMESIIESLQDAVSETLKYAVKPSDMVADPEWFLELTRQLFKRRFIATGGVFKNVLKLDKETNEELVLAEGHAEGKDDGSRLAFGWKSKMKRYKREPKKDKLVS